MPSNRARKLAHAKYLRQQNRRAHRRTRNRFLTVAGIGFAVLLIPLWLNYQSAQTDQDIAQPSETPSISAAEPISTAEPIPGCELPNPVRANNIIYGAATTDLPTASSFTVETNCGVIEFATDPNAPTTVGTMAWLANEGFFNNTACSRLTTQGIFVLQCGDPAGDRTGGPGFKFADENLPLPGPEGEYIYPRGTVAMANSGPDTNGSQFFLVYQDSPLPPNYTIWGSITSGLDVLENIATAGISNGSSDGQPAQAVVISRASTTP
ncbi:MAG: peptidylprolyl isomerase [Actinomycetes bacterium]